jgi:hypothetical protein
LYPDILITDFERTEHTDRIHAVLGRVLIIATRFDSMCEEAALLRKGLFVSGLIGEAEYAEFASKVAERRERLVESINSLHLPKNVLVILHDARRARNLVAHDLAKNLTGCLDTRVNEGELLRKVSDLVIDIAYGDLAISLALTDLDRVPMPIDAFIISYRDKIVSWVVEE